jgi:hypothetical protein
MFSMSAPISMMRRLLLSQRTIVLGVMEAGRWLLWMQRGQVKGRVGFFVEEASVGISHLLIPMVDPVP